MCYLSMSSSLGSMQDGLRTLAMNTTRSMWKRIYSWVAGDFCLVIPARPSSCHVRTLRPSFHCLNQRQSRILNRRQLPLEEYPHSVLRRVLRTVQSSRILPRCCCSVEEGYNSTLPARPVHAASSVKIVVAILYTTTPEQSAHLIADAGCPARRWWYYGVEAVSASSSRYTYIEGEANVTIQR